MTHLSLHKPEIWSKDYKQIMKNTFQKFNEKDFLKFLLNELNFHRISDYRVDTSYKIKMIEVFYEERK